MRPAAPQEAPKTFWFVLAFFLFTTAVTFVAGAEILVRFWDHGRRMAAYKENASLFEIAPFLQIRPRTSAENHVNEDNLRGDPLDLSTDTFRIFTLGGSTTFSGELPYEKTYPAKLEKRLRERYPDVKIQVQNAACDWYSTQHSIIRYLFKIRHFEPHLLIMKHGINDLFRGFTADCCSFPDSEFETSYAHYFGPIYRLAAIAEDRPPPPFDLMLWNKGRRLLQKLSWAPHTPTDELAEYASEYATNPTSTDIHNFRSLSVFESNLRLMARLARIHQTRLIFVTQSSLFRKDLSEEEMATLYFGPFHMSEKGVYPSVESLEHGMNLFNAATLSVGKQQEVPVADVAANTPKTLEYLFDDVHPTEKGLEIDVELLFNIIVESRMIETWLEKGMPRPLGSAYKDQNRRI